MKNDSILVDGKANGSLKHLRGLTEMMLPHRCQQVVFQEVIQVITERMRRLARLGNGLTHQIKPWR